MKQVQQQTIESRLNENLPENENVKEIHLMKECSEDKKEEEEGNDVDIVQESNDEPPEFRDSDKIVQ